MTLNMLQHIKNFKFKKKKKKLRFASPKIEANSLATSRLDKYFLKTRTPTKYRKASLSVGAFFSLT